jgi:hypothetical protein
MQTAVHLDPWVSDTLLATCTSLLRCADEVSLAVEGFPLAEGDAIGRFVRNMRANVEGGPTLTADDIWGMMVNFASANGVVSLRRRFEEMEAADGQVQTNQLSACLRLSFAFDGRQLKNNNNNRYLGF